MRSRAPSAKRGVGDQVNQVLMEEALWVTDTGGHPVEATG